MDGKGYQGLARMLQKCHDLKTTVHETLQCLADTILEAALIPKITVRIKMNVIGPG
jgi:hypothetical protein